MKAIPDPNRNTKALPNSSSKKDSGCLLQLLGMLVLLLMNCVLLSVLLFMAQMGGLIKLPTWGEVQNGVVIAQATSQARIYPSPTPIIPKPVKTPSWTPTRTLWLASSTPFVPPTFTAPPTFPPSPPTYTPIPTLAPVVQEAAYTPTASPSLPLNTLISKIVVNKQTLPLSSEARSAVDWAAFFGKTIDELEFQNRLPKSDNPNIGFVGDPNGLWGQIPPNSYGVYSGPVAALLRTYGVNAQARRNMSWNQLKTEIAGGKPVIVWIKGNLEPGAGVPYISSNGSQTMVTPFERTALFVGYNQTVSPAMVDLLIDGTPQKYPLSDFLSSWNIFNNMAITKGG
ncbi:MAG: C39 family peptidase [Chloroflexota bacterium]|jgi:uncharacterized protein YvpB